MTSGHIKTKGLQKAIKATTSKTVIPFKHYALDDVDTAWDGPAERRDADIADLKVMSTWFDSESPDTKSSYKLPHHRADGHNTVWRGTAAAMVALLGGRGGVDIPDGDRRSVYNHLKRHYTEFDKPVPEFKHYTATDLKGMDLDPEVESIETSAGEVSGGWESVEIEERDPVEIMRQDGLEKEKDGLIPVTTELWNSIMDSFSKIQENSAEALTTQEHEEVGEDIEEGDQIEVTEEEISLMVQQELKILEQTESLTKLSHAYKLLKAKFEVLQGGIG
jgi:hypothetical protein